MILLLLFAALVSCQLSATQYNALIAVYDALGCQPSACPRFDANSSVCPMGGGVVTCANREVVQLRFNMLQCLERLRLRSLFCRRLIICL